MFYRNRLLMCRPSAYDLSYEINAWMHLENKPNRELAERQWQELYAVLVAKAGAEIILVEQASDCPDMVFTANAALISGDTAILSQFRHKERMLEQPHFAKCLSELGFKLFADLQGDGSGNGQLPFEGEGDALFTGSALVVAHGLRSGKEAHEKIAALVDTELVSVELIDERWYHLDTCFLPLGRDRIVFYPGAFSEESVRVIRKRFQCLEIETDEALNFGCNAVVCNQTIVLPSNCPKLVKTLRSLSFDVHSVQMTEFIKAGGACKCLVLYI